MMKNDEKVYLVLYGGAAARVTLDRLVSSPYSWTCSQTGPNSLVRFTIEGDTDEVLHYLGF